MAAFGGQGVGGFTFGGPSTTATTTTAMPSVGLGTPLVSSTPAVSSQIGATTNPLGGLGFGTTTPVAGFNLGSTGQQTSGTAGPTQSGFGFGAPASVASNTLAGLLSAPTTTVAATGPSAPTLGFGLTAATTPSTGFGVRTAAQTTASTGFTGLGGTAPASTGLSLGQGITQTSGTSTGFSLGLGGTTTPATTTTGLSLGIGGTATPASTTTGLSLGLGGLTGASTGTGLGLGLGGTAVTSATSLSTGIGLGGAAATATVAPFGIAKSVAPSSNLFGTGSTLTTTTAAGSIFGAQATKPTTTGLGGVDPKTSTSLAGGSSTDAKTSDGKTVKETVMPQEVTGTVQTFQNYVKEEKAVRESIARMSCKPMYKVQEDIVALKQLLSVVSNGLQRNACAVEKLKIEMRQELKNAEMSQRTQDIPPGLQYENTAPTEYFQRLVETFEGQMQSYRQQIEMLESHLASTQQTNKLTPEDLIILLKKLHETFVALAANLHQIHEAVKTQKEHYLNYRKIFHSDSKNIFERHKKTHVNPVTTRPTDLLGPSPFSGISSAATAAMAAALNRSQQPVGAPPIAGLGTTTLGQPGGLFGPTATTTTPAFSGFGTTATAPTQSNLFGAGFGKTTTSQSVFGAPLGGLSSNTATVRPLGFGTSTGTASVFGNATQPSMGFGATSQTQGTTGFGFGAAAPQAAAPGNLNMSAATEQPFTLGKPPGKRGKR